MSQNIPMQSKKPQRAYKILTILDDENTGDYTVYSAVSAGEARKLALADLRNIARDSNYKWIKGTSRAKDLDKLAGDFPDCCIAWKLGNHTWQKKSLEDSPTK
jgi:hypothetical protein